MTWKSKPSHKPSHLMDKSLISFNNWIVITEPIRGIIFSLELLLASRTLSTIIQRTYNS